MNKPSNNNRPAVSNGFDSAETLVSNLLPDVMLRRSPPDLRKQVKARLDGLNVVSGPFSEADYEAAVFFAESELQKGYGLTFPSSQQESQRQSHVDPRPGAWVRRFVVMVSGIAALIALVFLVPLAIQKWNEPDQSQIAIETPNRVESFPDSNAQVADAPSDQGDRSAENMELPKPKSPIDDETRAVVDAAPASSNESTAAPRSPSTKQEVPLENNNRQSSSNALVHSLTDRDIVGVIDDQFEHLWKRVRLAALPNVKSEEWLDRAAMAIVGRVLTAAEKEVYRANRSEQRDVEFVNKLVDSGEFASHWAELMAEHYLGYRVIGIRKQAAPQRQFVQWLADNLSKHVFVGDIERDMVGSISKLPIESTSERQDPASFWIAETMERTAIDLGQSPSALLTTPSHAKHASHIDLARQLIRVSGNSALVCAQCHQAESRNDGTLDLLAVKPESSTAGTSAFWQVPASLSGMSFVRRNENERVLVQSSTKDFFFEDAEGRLNVATAGPPTLVRSDSFNTSLGEWMYSSLEPRRAHVDMVWGKVFGQPLVPVFGLTEDEGRDERIDLRDLLAEQLQSGKKDLGSLVRWLVLSHPFRVEGQVMDSPWYLRSTDQQMADTQRQMRLFASSSSPKPAAQEYGKLSASRVAAWIENKRSFDSKNQALAQRMENQNTPNKSPQVSKSNYSEDQVRYLVSVARPYDNLGTLADRLASSSMKWPELLDHAFLVSDSRTPNKSERDEANKLFEATGRDRAKALVMIIQARLGTH
ncbi:MAG: DUF1549 domain-containing protein [Pirellula sp.]